MKRLLILLLLCVPCYGQILQGIIGSAPAAAANNFSLVQKVIKTDCGNNAACTITVAATAAGSTILIVPIAFDNGNGRVFSSSSGTHCANALIDNNYTGTSHIMADCAYVLSDAGGNTTYSWTWDVAPNVWSIHFYEFSHTGGSVSIGTPVTVSDTSCTTCAGAAVTPGTNSVIVQFSAAPSVTAIDSSYTITVDVSGFASAYKLNTASGAAPNWTQSSSALLKGTGVPFNQ